MLSSGAYATITYYQFSFLYNLRFLQTKGMRHTLDPLHCYSLGGKEALSFPSQGCWKNNTANAWKVFRGCGYRCCTLWGHAKRTDSCLYQEIACVGARSGDLEKGNLCYFPKSVLGLLGDAGKSTFLLRTSISPAIVWEQYYWPYNSGDRENWIHSHAECFTICITDCGWELTVSLSWCNPSTADFEPLIFQC